MLSSICSIIYIKSLPSARNAPMNKCFLKLPTVARHFSFSDFLPHSWPTCHDYHISMIEFKCPHFLFPCIYIYLYLIPHDRRNILHLVRITLPTYSDLAFPWVLYPFLNCIIKLFLCLALPLGNGHAYLYYSRRILLASHSPRQISRFLFPSTEPLVKNCLHLLSPLPHITFAPPSTRLDFISPPPLH